MKVVAAELKFGNRHGLSRFLREDIRGSIGVGNLLGHLPVELQAGAWVEMERELDALKTPEGIRFENARIIAVAVKQ